MKIAILGTGLMGSAMAEALLEAGHEVLVYNRTPARTAPLVALGATAVATAAEAIQSAEATILVLIDAQAVRDLLLKDATKSALQGKKLLNASTTAADEIIEIGEQVSRSGGRLSEISIQVGSEQLRKRQGHFALGCCAEDEKFWTEILASIGENVSRSGELGTATSAEAPMLIASMFATVSIAYSVAVSMRLNIPRDVYEPALKTSGPWAEYILPLMAERNYDEVFGSVESYISGLKIAVRTAQKQGMPTKTLEDMLALFESAVTLGYAGKDGSAVLEVLLHPEHQEAVKH